MVFHLQDELPHDHLQDYRGKKERKKERERERERGRDVPLFNIML